MNELKEALAKIEDKEAESKLNPGDADPRTRNGVEAMVRNAKKDLDKLYRNYKALVMNHVVIIGVKGASAAEFAKAAEQLGSISVDFNLVKNRLVTQLGKSAVGDVYSSHAHFRLIAELHKVKMEYEMKELPTPKINGYSDGIYDSPFNVAVSKLIDNNYGSSLQSAITRREIEVKALAARFSGKKLPVVVYNLDKEIDSQYLSQANTIIESDGDVTLDSVKKKLSGIAKSLTQKLKTETESSQTQEN